MSLFDFDDLGATLESHDIPAGEGQVIDLEAIHIPVGDVLTSEVELLRTPCSSICSSVLKKTTKT